MLRFVDELAVLAERFATVVAVAVGPVAAALAGSRPESRQLQLRPAGCPAAVAAPAPIVERHGLLQQPP